uniref:Uncharacterized protein n=1 Tax=Panstrongylus lignarius TaxID=156445 RepID=A0A224Y3F3_9HEMI
MSYTASVVSGVFSIAECAGGWSVPSVFGAMFPEMWACTLNTSWRNMAICPCVPILLTSLALSNLFGFVGLFYPYYCVQ